MLYFFLGLNHIMEELVDFMFIKNKTNTIAMSLPELDTTKDLFYFLLDLFCKGLVVLFGKENRVIIQNLTENDFEIIQNKMLYAGIEVYLSIYEHSNVSFSNKSPINLTNIENLPEYLDLNEYSFKMLIENKIYKVYFNLKRAF